MSINRTKLLKTSIIIVILGLISFLNILPLLNFNFATSYMGDDFFFHVQRVLALSNIFKSPVNFDVFAHTATMANIFYPWETVYPLYLIYHTTGDFFFSYKLFYFLITFLTAILAYWCLFKISNNTFSSFCFAALYVFSFYRSTNFFVRSALGEAVSMTFLPLVLLGLYYILFDDYNKWRSLSVGMTLITYSHTLSLFMTSILIVVGFMVSLGFLNQRKARIKSLFTASFWTVILCSPYLFLVINTSLNNKLYLNWQPALHGLPLADWLMNSLGNRMYPNLNVRSSLGASVVIAGVLAFMLFIIVKRSRTAFSTFCLWGGLGIMLISTSLFPWFLTNNTIFGRIQFVWRLNAYISLLLLASFSLILGTVIRKNVLLKSVFLLALIAGLTIGNTTALATFTAAKAEKTPREGTLVKNVKNIFYGDYTPEQVQSKKNLQQILQKQFFLNAQQINPVYHFTDNDFTVQVDNPTQSHARLTIPVFWYASQVVTVNQKPVHSKISKTGATLVTIPKGSSVISVSYQYPKSVVVFIVIACFGLAAIFMPLIFRNTGSAKVTKTD